MLEAKNPSQRRYPPELRERAIRMVLETIRESGERQGVVTKVARQLGIVPESLRNWVKQAEVDQGRRPDVSTEEQRRVVALEKENRELRRANEILNAGGGFLREGVRPSTAQVVRFVTAFRHRWGVEPICRVLQFAPSTYYSAISREPSRWDLRDAVLKEQIARVHRDNFCVYGVAKVWHQLHREGWGVGRGRVGRA